MQKYIRTADMLKEVILKRRQLKQVLYNRKQSQKGESKKELSVSASYSLLSLVTNNYEKFETFVERLEGKMGQDIKNRFLLIVMTAEYLNTGKIQGGGKLKKLIIENIELLPQIQRSTKINKSTVQVRLIRPTSQTDLEAFSDFERYSKLFKDHFSLPENSLIKNLFDLSAQQYQKTVQKHPQILKSSAVAIQSLSSCLPPLLLMQGVSESSLKSFRLMDACSAPGNKTIQLAEYSQKAGYTRQVLAFQKDPKRFEVLRKNIQRHKMQGLVKSYNKDYLKTSPSQFKNVKFILLDPSCSGSGMLSNQSRDYTLTNESQNSQSIKAQETNFQAYCDMRYSSLSEKEKNRVECLHDFQLQLLRHAACFEPKRISYSTCSIYKRENEDVVAQFLNSNQEYAIRKNKAIEENLGRYCLAPGFGKAFENCVRVDPRTKQTDGFFVTIFYRKKKLSSEQS